MTIDATQSTGLIQSQTQSSLTTTPKAKIEVKEADGIDKAQAKKADEKEFSLFGDDGVSFWDVLDVINPLQHIPIISGIYRELTGDQIDPAMKLAGGTLFGGFIGLGAAAIDVAIEGATGKDIGEHMVALATEDVGEQHTEIVFEHMHDDDFLPEQQVTASSPKESSAAQSAGVAATNAALISAAETKPATSQSGKLSTSALSDLPDWNAASQTTKFDTNSVASLNAPNKTINSKAKSFPMPEQRYNSSQHQKSLAELRAESDTVATTHSTLTSASQLSPEAMRAAGLTQDMVNEILRFHGKQKSSSTSENKDEATPSQLADVNSTDKSEDLQNAWMFSAMNQALDKYQAANNLKNSALQSGQSLETQH